MCDYKKQEHLANGKYLTENLIYKATVKMEKGIKTYISSTGLMFTDNLQNRNTIIKMKNIIMLQPYHNLSGNTKIII